MSYIVCHCCTLKSLMFFQLSVAVLDDITDQIFEGTQEKLKMSTFTACSLKLPSRFWKKEKLTKNYLSLSCPSLGGYDWQNWEQHGPVGGLCREGSGRYQKGSQIPAGGPQGKLRLMEQSHGFTGLMKRCLFTSLLTFLCIYWAMHNIFFSFSVYFSPETNDDLLLLCDSGLDTRFICLQLLQIVMLNEPPSGVPQGGTRQSKVEPGLSFLISLLQIRNRVWKSLHSFSVISDMLLQLVQHS